MTRRQLSQIYYLKKELQMWERELNELIQSSQVKAQSIDGIPFQNTGEVSDKVAQTAIKIIEHTEMVEALRFNIAERVREIDEYIMTLDDPLLKQIIQYRCCKLMSWDKVATMVGGNNTADSCRKYFNRKIEKD